MVPDPANRCSSPEKALSMRDGIPGKTKTLRTLTCGKKEMDAFVLFFKPENVTVTSQNLAYCRGK